MGPRPHARIGGPFASSMNASHRASVSIFLSTMLCIPAVPANWIAISHSLLRVLNKVLTSSGMTFGCLSPTATPSDVGSMGRTVNVEKRPGAVEICAYMLARPRTSPSGVAMESRPSEFFMTYRTVLILLPVFLMNFISSSEFSWRSSSTLRK
jgi:hypothetical protein